MPPTALPIKGDRSSTSAGHPEFDRQRHGCDVQACQAHNAGLPSSRLPVMVILPISHRIGCRSRHSPSRSSRRCSSRFSRQSPRAWAWACRLRGPLSRPTAGTYRQRTERDAARRSASNYLLQRCRHDCFWHIASSGASRHLAALRNLIAVTGLTRSRKRGAVRGQWLAGMPQPCAPHSSSTLLIQIKPRPTLAKKLRWRRFERLEETTSKMGATCAADTALAGHSEDTGKKRGWYLPGKRSRRGAIRTRIVHRRE